MIDDSLGFPRPSLPPAEDELHLWIVDLESAPFTDHVAGGILSDDEVVRADRFRSELHRRRFTRGRMAMRKLLAAYFGEDAGGLCFSYGPQGKPAVVPRSGFPTGLAESLRFSFSHSEERATLAVVWGAEVGVDVEFVREVQNLEQLTARFFSPEENAALEQLPAAEQVEAFYRYWTCKEAVLKATGSGLSGSLRSFAVAFGPDRQPEVSRFDDEEPEKWWLHSFSLPEGYVGAIALRGSPREVRVFRWGEGERSR